MPIAANVRRLSGAMLFPRGTWKRGVQLALVCYLAALAMATHVPRWMVPRLDPPFDKLEHFGAYFVLAALAFALVRKLRPHVAQPALGMSTPRVLLVLGGVTLLGIVDEVTQPYFGRTCDMYDLLADVLGGYAAVLLMVTLSESWFSRMAWTRWSERRAAQATCAAAASPACVAAATAGVVIVPVVPVVDTAAPGKPSALAETQVVVRGPRRPSAAPVIAAPHATSSLAVAPLGGAALAMVPLSLPPAATSEV